MSLASRAAPFPSRSESYGEPAEDEERMVPDLRRSITKKPRGDEDQPEPGPFRYRSMDGFLDAGCLHGFPLGGIGNNRRISQPIQGLGNLGARLPARKQQFHIASRSKRRIATGIRQSLIPEPAMKAGNLGRLRGSATLSCRFISHRLRHYPLVSSAALNAGCTENITRSWSCQSAMLFSLSRL